MLVYGLREPVILGEYLVLPYMYVLAGVLIRNVTEIINLRVVLNGRCIEGVIVKVLRLENHFHIRIFKGILNLRVVTAVARIPS